VGHVQGSTIVVSTEIFTCGAAQTDSSVKRAMFLRCCAGEKQLSTVAPQSSNQKITSGTAMMNNTAAAIAQPELGALGHAFAIHSSTAISAKQ